MLGVFAGARLLAGPGSALVAAALYAAMPSALQLSSFHTVDVWLAAACTGALVPMIALARGQGNVVAMATIAGSFIGLAMASKITGVLMLAPGLVALGLAWRGGLTARQALVATACAVLALAIVFRLTNPFAFVGPGPLGVALSQDYITDFTGLADVTASPDFPAELAMDRGGYGPPCDLRVILRCSGSVLLLSCLCLACGDLFAPGLWLLWQLGACLLALTALSFSRRLANMGRPRCQLWPLRLPRS